MNQFSFIAISDVHLGEKLFNLAELAEDLKSDFSKAISLAILKKTSYLFIAGDLFDTNRPPPDLVNFVKNEVARAAAGGVTVAGILGDHDKPVNGIGWMHLADVLPIESLGNPKIVGLDYNDDSPQLIEQLKTREGKEQIEWIFLHGQVPELFPFVEEKKKLDVKSLNLHRDFPALKGIVLGDIHSPVEGKMYDPKDLDGPGIFIGYCGSLGVTKIKEAQTRKGVIYYDGSTLHRLPFPTSRRIIRIDAAELDGPIDWAERYSQFFKDYKGKRPLFVVDYDANTKKNLTLINPLYAVGIVHCVRRVAQSEDSTEETPSLLSEVSSGKYLELALQEEFGDSEEALALAKDLLSADDYTTVLDRLKAKYLQQDEGIFQKTDGLGEAEG